MSLKIVKLEENKYKEWNEFCFFSDTAWFRHTTWFLDYILNCRFDEKSKNLSFMVYQNNKFVAIVPLIMQNVYGDEQNLEFALLDTNVPFPAFNNNLSPEDRKHILKVIFREIDRLAEENNVNYARFFNDPLAKEILQVYQRINLLPKFGFFEISLTTNIISLTLSEKALFDNIRKGHKADINSAKKSNFEVNIFGKENISNKNFESFKNLHFLAAGRKTRRDESWEKMLEFIRNDYAILVLAREQNHEEYFTGIFLLTYKGKAYYGSSATHPEFKLHRGAGHLLQWEAIKYLKQNNYQYYELGWNYYPILSQEIVTEKELNISHFKSGFGGEIYPLFRGEKFYSKEYFYKTYTERINKYMAILNSNLNRRYLVAEPHENKF